MTSPLLVYFRFGFVAALAAASRGLVPEGGVAGDVTDTWSLSCSEAHARCHVHITCRVLLETIDKVCDQSGTIIKYQSAISVFLLSAGILAPISGYKLID